MGLVIRHFAGEILMCAEVTQSVENASVKHCA